MASRNNDLEQAMEVGNFTIEIEEYKIILSYASVDDFIQYNILALKWKSCHLYLIVFLHQVLQEGVI